MSDWNGKDEGDSLPFHHLLRHIPGARLKIYYSALISPGHNVYSDTEAKAEAESAARLLQTHTPKLKISTVRYADEDITVHLYHTFWQLQMEMKGCTAERALSLEAMKSHCKLCRCL
jgi:hypothetical protein